ncbi:hypothetical protein YERSI8AC_690005 [Enterobacterales bacterium 8AC]|nr:hypothetical protein YERSI8AC_690005 [Enterobacterales bacterium 8AC]
MAKKNHRTPDEWRELLDAQQRSAGAKKNTPMNSAVMGWVALEAALVPKSIWRQIAQDYR